MLTIELNRISRISAQGIKVQNLASLINEKSLKDAHTIMDAKKATGIDRVTKESYGQELVKNLEALVNRMKGGTYTPNPSRRTYIDKPGTNKKRPLGISCYEDKLVEKVIAEILTAVYEPKFLDCSFGFRPERNCHEAISTCLHEIQQRTSYIVEADIRSYFDRLDHDRIIEFLEHDIADRQFMEIIKRFLKAGYVENNVWHDSETGSPQGSGFSPCIANVYLHYVLDTWFNYLKKHGHFRGDAWIVRYADDFVCGFQYVNDAKLFYKTLPKRFGKFGLELAEEKTRIVEFGRFAESNCQKKRKVGLTSRNKPETFDFLGFTFYCSKSGRTGEFTPKVKSAGKRMRTKLQKMEAWIKDNRHLPLRDIIQHINQVLEGYYTYYAVTCNLLWVCKFRYSIIRMLYKWLNRRSQRRSYTWPGFADMLKDIPILRAKVRVNIYGYIFNRKAKDYRGAVCSN